MRYEELTLDILQSLSNNWNKVVSLDIETDVATKDDFLTDEYILGVTLALRSSGSMTEIEGIRTKTLILQNQDKASESRLLQELNGWLKDARPLGVMGYGNRKYDLPLLTLKTDRYNRSNSTKLWPLIDLLQQAVHVDLYFILKTQFGVQKLADVFTTDAFRNLPLVHQKHLVGSGFEEKGRRIMEMWQNDHESFTTYNEGDAINALLLAEYLLMKK